MGIFRMYTGDDGKSVMEELQVDDPILETLKTCTGIHSFGPNDLRLWEDVTGEGHKTRFPVPSVSISMPLP